MLEAGNWAPTHQKTEPWRYIVFSGSESIMTYLDYLDDYYNNCEELSETEAAKFRNKMSGARNTWVTNASAVIVIGQAELFFRNFFQSYSSALKFGNGRYPFQLFLG